MSLVIAFIGRQGAVMGGDMREIITRGERRPTEILENELYSGRIVTDEDLKRRADELGIFLSIRDDKRKVTVRDGVLVGEVSESEGGVVKKRRLYACSGGYTIAEVTGSGIDVSGSGRAGNFVLLGNRITQEVARSCIREHWTNGTIADAIRVIILAMEKASEATASVSALYTLIQTRTQADIPALIDKDRAL